MALPAALLAGCLYGFAGGGLPSHIRTAAILPFDNQTAEPALTQEVTEAVVQAIEGRLGLRSASEATADAVVRGSIVRYEPDIPLSFQAGQRGQVAVTRRKVQLTVNVEIYDLREDRVLWQRSGLVVDGEYDPPREADGRRVALEKLVTDIVDGAQSQW
ncbi:MAG: LPS assembly lipoprotein LptE [Gemmatimonadales bacterium]